MGYNLPQQYLHYEVLIEFLRRMVDYLIKQRNISLAHLFRAHCSLEKRFKQEN